MGRASGTSLETTDSNKEIRKVVDQSVTTMYFDDVGAGWEQWILLQSDNHHDSIMCNRDLEEEHLEEAMSKNARVFILGDLFDAMQGRFDPRKSMDLVRPEYKSDRYYDLLVKDMVKFLTPYSKNIDIMALGNHESKVIKYANTSLLDNTAYLLNMATDSHISRAGYGGYVKFVFNINSIGQSLNLKYYHGSGGEAPVTRGAIQTNRQAVFLRDADIVVNGHSHHSYYFPISQERLSNRGKIWFSIQHHIRVPGYCQSYGDGTSGWEVERGGVPKPVGCAWIRLWYTSRTGRQNNNGEVRVQVIPDVRGADAINLDGNDYDFGEFNGIEYPQDSEYP